MFTNADIEKLDHTYFRVITASPFALTLESVCTGHQWHIVYREANGHPTCAVYHRHKETDCWHVQWGSKTLEKTIEAIKEHDGFQLSGRKT